MKIIWRILAVMLIMALWILECAVLFIAVAWWFVRHPVIH